MTMDEIQKTSEQKIDRRRKEFRQKPVAPEPTQIDVSPTDTQESAAARTQTRSSARTRPDGRIEVEGRGGEVLSRTRTYVGDIFEVPLSDIPKGWGYQWNAVSIAGNSDILLDQAHMMHQNGWRAVPAERHAGSLVPKGSTGPIIRGQQMLMERPLALIEEAQADDLRNARQLISDRNESLKLTKVKDQLPDGMAMSSRYKGTGGGMRMEIDKSLDVLNVNREAGNYKLDE
jgi:hypothetical protein